MKKCVTCGQNQLIEFYNFSNETLKKRRAQCKNCTRKLGRAHYQKNKQYYTKKAKGINQKYYYRNREIICKYLLTHPCIDCGEKDIIVLEFDHLRDKKFAISMVTNKSVGNLLLEIEKCEVRCANCHRRKTAMTLGHYRNKYALLVQQTE